MARSPRAMHVVLTATLAALVLSGCATPTQVDAAAADASSTSLALASLADGIPCEADGVALGELSANLREVNADALSYYSENWRGEFDIHDLGDRTLLAAGRSGGVGGFDLFDITDPTTILPVGEWDGSDYGFQDLKFTPDGTAIVHADHQNALVLVDVRDPAKPVVEAEYPLEDTGAHMVATWTVGGVDHVSISKAEGKDVSIFALRGEPGARAFERIARPTLDPVGDMPRSEDLLFFNFRSHDTWFEEDPETGTPLLWIANVFWGAAALDVSDPAQPKLFARIPHTDPYAGYTHSVQVAHVEGKRYVVATTEYGFGGLKAWDATDPAAPALVADWRMDLPTIPSHNLQVVGPYAFVAHFYEGLLVFDLGTIGSGGDTPLAPYRLEPIAHAPPLGDPLPARIPASPGLLVGQDYYGALDVAVEDGLVWVSEGAYGVRAFAFGCMTPGDETLSSWG